MLELVNFNKEHDSTLANHEIKPLYASTFVGLFNSFNSAFKKLSKLKEQGSIDILTVKKDLNDTRDHVFEIYSLIESILRSYKTGFGIENDSMKCDFCPDIALKYQDYHKWCDDCFNREFGGVAK